MVKNLKRYKRQLEKDGKMEEAAQFNFFPLTFVLPGEYLLYVEAFKKIGGTWIMKPVGKSQGKGIFLVDKLSQTVQWKSDYRLNNQEQQVMFQCLHMYHESPLCC